MGDIIFLKGCPREITKNGRVIKPAEPDVTIYLADSAHGKPGDMNQCRDCEHYEPLWNLCRKYWTKRGNRKLLMKCTELVATCGLADNTNGR